MKNKKGFTLIELLAIIVILAIIAVITVPIILGIIDDSKQNAAVASAYGFKDAVEKNYVKKLLTSNEQDLNGTYTITNGKLGNTDLPISGAKPSNGSLTYDNNKLVSGCLTIDGYKVQYQNDKFTATKGDCNAALVCGVNEHIVNEFNGYEKNLNAISNTCETYFKIMDPDSLFFINDSDIIKYCNGKKILSDFPLESYDQLINNNILIDHQVDYEVDVNACITFVAQNCESDDSECLESGEYWCNNMLYDINDDIQENIWDLNKLKLYGIVKNDGSLNKGATSNTCTIVTSLDNECTDTECIEEANSYCNSNNFSDYIDNLIDKHNDEFMLNDYVNLGIINENITKSCATTSYVYVDSDFDKQVERLTLPEDNKIYVMITDKIYACGKEDSDIICLSNDYRNNIDMINDKLNCGLTSETIQNDFDCSGDNLIISQKLKSSKIYIYLSSYTDDAVCALVMDNNLNIIEYECSNDK